MYDIDLLVTDRTTTYRHRIEIRLFNNIPYHDEPILFNSENNISLMAHPRKKLDFHISMRSFVDIDYFDHLYLKIRMANNKKLPRWLIFEDVNAKLTGTPTKEDMQEKCPG